MSSTFGKIFRVTTFGESHCKGVGVVVDGCPPGLELSETDIQFQLDRRKPGQSKLTTERKESDQVVILSGVENGRSLGTPIGLMVANRDQRPGDYSDMQAIPRPSHADFTYQVKYGIRAGSGGGRASARETIGRVAAGAIAEKVLRQVYGVQIVAWVSAVGDIDASQPDMENITRQAVDKNLVRCPDQAAAAKITGAITEAKNAKDSLGGVVSCVCRNLPAGLGEPVFDKLDALLAMAMLSIPATKGFEVGSGFAGARMRGSQHNDPFIQKGKRLGTVTNYSGGIQGGISNAEPVYFRVAFKPPATIGREQATADFKGKETVLAARGRHDPCVVTRAVPIVETMAALVLLDCAMRQSTRCFKDLTPC
ncbi:MAG: chorismate synthase [Desulfobacteraceae bacterium]|nr:chorismate synthase [Desulfobacteraceae bacterium]